MVPWTPHQTRGGFTIRLKRLKPKAPDFEGPKNFQSKENFQHFCNNICIFLLFNAHFFTMPLTADIYRTGSPNFFIRGPHKLLHKSAWVGHLTQWDCFGICYILPNQKVFCQLIFQY